MALTSDHSPPVAQALVACRGCLCLATTGKMYCFETAELKKEFFNITGLEVLLGDGLPQHICHGCCGLLRKAVDFRNKCHSTHALLSSHPVTLEFIQNIHTLQGQPLQNTDIVSVNFDSNSVDLQSDIESDSENHLNSDKEDSKSDLLNSQQDTDSKWATENNLNDNDLQRDIDSITVVDEKFGSIVYKVNNETENCIPFEETKCEETEAETMATQYTLNNSVDLQSDIESDSENHINNDEEDSENDVLNPKESPDSKLSTENNVNGNDQSDDDVTAGIDEEFDSIVDKVDDETKNIEGEKYDYKSKYEMSESKYKGKENKKKSRENYLKRKTRDSAEKYNFTVEFFNKEEQLENLRARMDTDNYKLAKFKCTDCHAGFETRDQYKEHRERHDSATNGNYKCGVCKLRFTTKNALYYHTRPHTRRFICNQCSKVIHSANAVTSMREHFNNIHSSNNKICTGSKYECKFCSQVFSIKSSLRYHVYRKHGTVPCAICHFMMSPRGVARHMRQHGRAFTCSSCYKVFKDYAAIAKHIHTSPTGVCGADAWPCTKCGENLSTESDLRDHVDWCRRRNYPHNEWRVKHDSVELQTDADTHLNNEKKDNVFLRAKNYNFSVEHFSTMEEQIEKLRAKMETDKYKRSKFKCTDCYTGFQYEQTYKKHRERHYSAVHGNYKCAVCKLRFPTKKSHTRHMRYHKIRFTCNQCGVSFMNSEKMLEHFNLHNSGPKYECKSCSKLFDKKASMYQHVYFKHGTVPCGVCHFILSPQGIASHMKRQHVKTFTCSSCNKVFNDYAAIARHIHTSPTGVCGADAWPCTKCGENLSTEGDLRDHVVRCRRRIIIEGGPKKTKVKHGSVDLQTYAETDTHLNNAEKYTYLRPYDSYGKNINKEGEDVFLRAKNYNFSVKHFSNKEEQIENLRTKMDTDKYKLSQFKCTDCYIGFQNEEKFNKHRERHDSAVHGNYKCEVCKMRYLTNRLLLSHARWHKHKFTCNQCGVSSVHVTPAKLQEHFKAHNGGTKYKCEYCSHVSTKKASLFHHVYRHHGTVPCGICHFMILPGGVHRHMKRQHVNTFTCSSCNKVFNDYAAIARHIHTSPTGVCGADAWPCTKCGENLSTEGDLRDHVVRCRRGIIIEGGPKKTKKTKTGPKKTKTFTCSSCDKVFNDYAAIARHIHTSPTGVCGADAWPCTKCGENLSTEGDLRDHVVRCRRRIIIEGGPKKTKKAKTGPKKTKEKRVRREKAQKIICEWCAHISPSQSHHLIHARIHTGERPYACPQCPKAFRVNAKLRQHMAVHTHERAHQCSQCGKAYTTNAALWLHRRTVHEMHRRHACAICSQTFAVRRKLRKHLDTVHMNEPPDDREEKRNVKKEKKRVGSGVKKVGRGVKKVGKDAKRVGSGVKKVGKDVKRVGSGVKKVGKGVKRAGRGVKRVAKGCEESGEE